MSTTLWQQHGETVTAITLESPVWLSPQCDIRDTTRYSSGRLSEVGDVTSGLLILPVSLNDGAIAALLISDYLAGRVTLNGIPLPGGLSLARHADCFDIGWQKFWTSGASAPEETEYSPAKHSTDVFCFLTKARLRQSEPITICPGLPGKPCGMIYKRAAWETIVTQSARFRCPNCSFDPKSPVWKPRLPAIRVSLEARLQMLHSEDGR